MGNKCDIAASTCFLITVQTQIILVQIYFTGLDCGNPKQGRSRLALFRPLDFILANGAIRTFHLNTVFDLVCNWPFGMNPYIPVQKVWNFSKERFLQIYFPRNSMEGGHAAKGIVLRLTFFSYWDQSNIDLLMISKPLTFQAYQ